MIIKIFLSHKKEDTSTAKRIANYLWLESRGQISCYLDSLDSALLLTKGDDLGGYFRRRIADCTHLMAIVSGKTKSSWWVPFEIGIATEKQYPISTFAIEKVIIPDYLTKWPYLMNEADLSKYINIALSIKRSILEEGLTKIASSRRGEYARAFHESLRKSLRQL